MSMAGECIYKVENPEKFPREELETAIKYILEDKFDENKDLESLRQEAIIEIKKMNERLDIGFLNKLDDNKSYYIGDLPDEH